MPIRRFGEGGWKPVLVQPWADGIVYHYTEINGLLGILDSNVLWASSLIGLNDTSEASFGIELIGDEAEHFHEGVLRDAVTSLFGSEAFTAPVRESVYVVSASIDPDSLVHWRGYSGNRGFAIGIDPKVWLSVFLKGGRQPDESWGISPYGVPGWYRVLYQESEQRDLIRQVFEEHESGFDPSDRGAVQSLVSELGALLALCKPPAFESEQEVRFIAGRANDREEHFRAGAFGVLPYLELARGLGSGATGPRGESQPNAIAAPSGSLPLVSIKCGPGGERERAEAVVAIRRLAKACGYGDVEVSSSDAPFRWPG